MSERPSERVFYRDEEEFKKAFNAASVSIRKTAGSETIANVVWWGLVALTGGLYLGDRTLGWDFRHVIPGVDLVKPLVVVLIAMIAYHLASTRHHHGRIIRNRLCLKCGTRLAAAEVDDAGDGTCPKCERVFNLGEYRRPAENRGDAFRGYLDAAHFDKTVFAAAEQIRKTCGLGFEADLMGWLWIALGVTFGLNLVLDWDVLEWLPGDVPNYGIWFVVMLVWGSWYTARVKKLQPAIVEQHRCMNCGFCLLHTPTEADGLGRCPECGCEFRPGQYERPAEVKADGDG